MGDVHLISVNKNGKSLSNSMNSIASTISSSLAPHDLTNILNCNPEYICQADPGAWQHFFSSENLHKSFSSQLPSLGIASPITLPQTGYESNDETIEGAMIRELIGRLGNGEFDNGFTSGASHSTDYSYKFGEEDGWRGVDAFSNISFSLDLPLENNSLPVTSLAASACLAGIPSDPGNAESQDTFHFFCHATSSQFQPDCLASSKLAPMATVKEHIPAFSSPSAILQSRGKAMQSSCQREEECSVHYSSGSSHNAVQNPVQNPSTPVKGVTSGKKRKGSEDKIVDVPSPVTRAEHKIVKYQKPKMEDMKMKEQKSSESIKQAFRDSDCTNAKDPEPPKQDFIHVRARRGQATDSHSLAERVRREKISERMKLLQDLVPGCSKVSGKAFMLDEIINYVQSLQCQVEILSMKLASLNKRPNFSLDDIFSEEMSNLWMKKNKASFR